MKYISKIWLGTAFWSNGVPRSVAGHLFDVESREWVLEWSAVIGEGGTPASALYPSSPKTSQVHTPADSSPQTAFSLTAK